MTGLEHNFNHPVHRVGVNHLTDVVPAALVGAHHRAVDVEILHSKSVVHVRIGLVHLLHLFPDAVAGVKGHHVGPQLLHGPDDLLPYARVGAAGDQQAGPAGGQLVPARLPLLQHLRRPGLDDVAPLVQVEGEAARVHTGAHLIAAHGGRVQLAQLQVAEHHVPLPVLPPDGLADVILGDGDAVKGLQLLLEGDDLVPPEGEGGFIPAVGQLHDIGVLDLLEQLEHLLLAVAGGLAHHKVGEVEVGAGIGEGKAVAGLDEGAQVPGQVGLGCGDGLLGEGAQPHGQGPRRVHQLGGHKGAEHAHHPGALVLELLHAQKARLPGLSIGLKVGGQLDIGLFHLRHLPFS